MSCYICLDKCDHKSPCTCQAPVHDKCLARMRRHHGLRHECSICKGSLAKSADYYGLAVFALFVWFVTQSCH